MSEGQGNLKTPTPYSDKSDIPFGLMEDVIPTAIAMTPTGLKAIPAPGKTTGVFEKTYEYEKERWEAEFADGDFYTLSDIIETVNNLKSAHNADIADMNKCIAELTAELKEELCVKKHAIKRLTEMKLMNTVKLEKQ